jgi:phosphatidylinositol alpha-1,6-mannosyltransferase
VNRVLVVTNDFPPRPGGIQTFVYELVHRLDPNQVVVYASKWKGWADFDAAQDFPVIREDTSVLLPTPKVRRRAQELMRAHKCGSVLFGATMPLGLMGSDLRAVGAERIISLTHGHEAGLAQLPGGRQMLRRIGDRVDTVTYLGEYTRKRVAAALSSEAAARMVRLSPGVDAGLFRSDAGGSQIRERHGLRNRPVLVCVSRLMPRKGQDTLIRILPDIQRQVPDAALLLVGGGPYRGKLQRIADRSDARGDIVFTGSVPWAELPAHYAAGDVFAMPCRTRRAGLDVEGLGIVYLEASATGLPVIAGNSGGAPDAVLDGETGYVVEGRSPSWVASRTMQLLRDPPLSRDLGQQGHDWVIADWSWRSRVDLLQRLLMPPGSA